MYGLIIEGIRFMVVENFGQQVLTEVLRMTNLSDKAVSTHDQYSENIVPNLFRAICEVTNMTQEQIGVLAGRFFVQFLIRHGYGDLMHVMGRRFSDFLKGLDNIHEYFRFSYPKIRPPSFYCSSESEEGLVLHYRSRRQGYIAYVIGQLVELARVFYKQDVGVKVLKRKEKGKFQFVVIQLSFQNDGLGMDNRLKEKVKNLNEYLPVDTFSFLRMFPFFIAFNKNLDIQMCGQGLLNLMPDIPGLNMIEVFDLQKPCIKFTAEGCIAHENCNFQLESLHPVIKKNNDEITVKINGITEDKVEVEASNHKEEEHGENENLPYVTLRGPIIYLKGCETFLLLATCVVDGLDSMFRMGIYLNDYGDADCNREIIMASIQKSDTLKSLLDNEKQRSQVLTEMTREIADAKRKARLLLSQMMPMEVANTLLKTGQADHCEAFESVTIAFIRVCDFAKLTQNVAAVDVVNLLNTVYTLLDEIVDTHGVYKVETIGDSYMISAGVPYRDANDTEMIIDCNLHMLKKIKDSEITAGEEKRILKVKIGAFSGPCVGGIVGLRAPRYCLFGDTVNCASRMESHNKVPMTIQIGQKTKDRLEKQVPGAFKIKSRGPTVFKGKGEMKAYEVVSKTGRPRYIKNPPVKHDDGLEEEEEVDDGLDEEDDDHRTSAMSRMSISDSLNSRPGSSYSRRTSNSSTSEFNKNLAFNIAQTAALAIEQYVVQNSINPSHSTVEKVVSLQPVKTPKTQPINKPKEIKVHKETKKEIIAKKDFALNLLDSHEIAPLAIDSGRTPRPTFNELAQMNADHTNLNVQIVVEGDTPPILSPDHDVGKFSEEPADVIPQTSKLLQMGAASVDTVSEDDVITSSKPLPDLKATKKRNEMHELSSAKKLINEQKSKKEKVLETKKALPPISKKEKSEKTEVNGCKCDEIRADPKLKTKVCTIM